MFYVKEELKDGVEIHIEITDENVYSTCPLCGKEVALDLTEVFSDGDADLFATSVLCDTCSKYVLRKDE